MLMATLVITVLLFNLALQPKVPHTVYYSVPTDTTSCIYNGKTWTNSSGQVWDGSKWK